MIYVFYFFAFLQIILAIQSLRGGFAFRDYVKRELSKPPSNFTPFVSIIAPCKGIDEGLRENLSAVLQQNYPNYEVIFAVDSAEDEAVETIKSLTAESNVKTLLVTAGKASNESQKIHNMREALKFAAQDSEVFAFVDSDARPLKDWLKNLVAPLTDEKVGAATGYRWFVPSRGGFWTQIRAVWNASIASALGANQKSNFCWGGATAIRREVFERLNITEKWRGKLSSDYSLTNALKSANLLIYFVPQCLTADVSNDSASEILEFTTRQMKLTRMYAPQYFAISFAGSIIFVLFWITAASALTFGKRAPAQFFLIIFSMFVVFLLGAAKSLLRLQTVEKVLPNNFGGNRTAHLFLWSITPVLFIYNNLSALLSRRVVWRGIVYQMESAQKTRLDETAVR